MDFKIGGTNKLNTEAHNLFPDYGMNSQIISANINNNII